MGPFADDVCVFSLPLWLRLTALAGLRLVDSGPSSLWYQRCGAPPEAAMWIPAEAPGLCASVCLYGPMDGGVCPPCRQGACPRGFVRPESPTYPGCGPPLLPASADEEGCVSSCPSAPGTVGLRPDSSAYCYLTSVWDCRECYAQRGLQLGVRRGFRASGCRLQGVRGLLLLHCAAGSADTL